MSKFCQNCGKTLDDAVRFCDGCGAPQQVAEPQAPVATAEPKQGFDFKATFDKVVKEVKTFAIGFINRCKAEKKFLYTVIGIAAGVLVAIVLLALLIGGAQPESAIDNYIAASFKGSTSAVKKMVPKEYWEYYEDNYDEDLNDFLDDYKDNIEDTIDELKDEYGKNFKVTYKVRDKEKLSNKELKKIAEALADKYDLDEGKITAGYEIEIKMTIKGSEDDDTNKTTMTVIKYKGAWYLINAYEYGDDYRASFYFG